MLHLVLALTLGHPDYTVRQGSLAAVRSHPYLAAVVSVAAYYHPDKEVNHASRRLWNPRLSDCFYLTLNLKEPRDTIHEERVAAAERLGIRFEDDDIGGYCPQPPTYADRLYVKSKALMILPLYVLSR